MLRIPEEGIAHMRRLFCALVLWLACGPAVAGPPPTRDDKPCRHRAVERLRAASPDGYAIYRAMEDKSFFLGWLDCRDPELGLPTAVHESVHHITAETDAFPLLGGGEIARPHVASRFFPPARIAGRFRPGDFVDTYLRAGEASSAEDFLYLLDELNAYTHDLAAATALRDGGQAGSETQVAHRDGLSAQMAFVATYVETAEAGEPATWQGLRTPAVSTTVAALWGRAETVMAASCRIPDFGTEDRAFLRIACGARPRASLAKILGRAPICPAECLGPSARTVLRGDETRPPPRM